MALKAELGRLRFFRPLMGAVGALSVLVLVPSVVQAQQETGMSPTRVTLPTGPGSIEGLGENADIDVNMGLLGYSVPIEVPAGQAGLGPSLRLGYQSGAGNGVVGMGWSLDAPSIERMSSRGLPRYDRTDRIAADGGRELVAVDPSRGVYRARYEGGFVRYTWTVATDGVAGTWRAEYPDGRVGWFGVDEAGRPDAGATVGGRAGVFRWHLTALTDTHGHVVRFGYRRSGGLSLLESVRYGSTDGSRYEIRLDYEARPDVVSDAKPGVDLRLSERVRSITVRVRGVQQRRYALTYEAEAVTGGLSRLAGVARYGEGDVGPFPVNFRFTYSSGVPCVDTGCPGPVVRRIGSVGADFRAGTTDFVDLDGDALPDALDTRGGTHQIRRNRLAMDGTQSFDAPVASAVARGGVSPLGPLVELFDFDGDGFVDLLDSTGGRVLQNRATGDWGASVSVADANLRSMTDDADLRFVDYDGDRRTDLVHSDRTSTWYYLRRADGTFEPRETAGDPIGWSFSGDGLRLADVNGDGLQDAVLLLDGTVAHRLSLGRGQWAPRAEFAGVPAGLSLSATQLADVSGDGLADLLAVEADRVRYALNRGGTRFDVLREVRAVGTTPIPVRTGDTSLRLLDMNGNGSTDIVWVTPSGDVTFLDLFPQRPHLLTRIENGLGRATDITYGNSVAQMARDGGPSSWRHRVPFAMQVVDRIEESEARTTIRQRRDFRYHHGYWDGIEGQFRGFEEVEVERAGDATSEVAIERYVYDVGTADRYRKGLLLSKATESAGRVLDVVRHTFADCTLAEVPTTDPPVRWLCESQLRRELREGAAMSAWTVTGEDYAYDGYGNRRRWFQHGVLTVGGGACAACARDAAIFGAACGAQCLGDERLEETEYVTPARAGGRWLVRRPSVVRRRGREADALFSEERTYYDGEPLRGLPLGELTRGDTVRVVRRLEADGGGYRDVDVTRNRVDAHGNVLETRDANGHRRSFGYDDDGVLTVLERTHFDDRLAPYALTMRVDYHPVHEKITRSEDWRLEGVSSAEPLRVTAYGYDVFGRQTALARPGDTLEDPTEQWRFELGSPTSRIVHVGRSRTAAGDTEEAQCFDAFGRKLGTRTRLGLARWLVREGAEYDAQAHARAQYQPWESTEGTCTAPPATVRATMLRYDAMGRELGSVLPDADAAGGSASQTRHEYQPLVERRFDEEDTDATSEHRETPTVLRRDGLDRVVSIERTLDRMGHVLRLELRYDALGRLRGYVDPEGNEKVQRYDLFDRVVEVVDPDSGRTLRAFDDAGNLVRETDARGVTVGRVYDEANRVLGHWDAARADASRVSYQYDLPGDCSAARCTNVGGRLATVRYPLGARGYGVDRYGYSLRGDEVLRERTIDGVAFELRTVRDALGRTIGRRFPGGVGFDLTLDGAGRVVSVPGYVPELSYDARGQQDFEVYANGVATSWRYDARQRLTRLEARLPAGAPLQALGYRYDRASNILAIDDQAPVEGQVSWSAAYGYDALYRLRSARLDAGRTGEETLSWRYDDGDDIVEATSSRGAESPAHVGMMTYGDGTAAGPHAVVRAGELSYGYDRAGHANQRGQLALGWDHLGRLTGASRGTERVADYEYGPDEQRVRKTEGASRTLYLAPDFEVREGIATAYLMIGSRRVASVERRGLATWVEPDLAPGVRNGNVVRGESDGRITAGDAWLAQADAQGIASVQGAAGADAEQVLRTAARALLTADAGAVRFFHHDHLGSTVATTEGAGAAVSRATYYPFGLYRNVPGLSRETHGYSGKENDEGTGDIYFNYRYLDPKAGRWMSADPISDVFSLGCQGGTGQSGCLGRAGSRSVHEDSVCNRMAGDGNVKNTGGWVEMTSRYASFRNSPVVMSDLDGRLSALQWFVGGAAVAAFGALVIATGGAAGIAAGISGVVGTQVASAAAVVTAVEVTSVAAVVGGGAVAAKNAVKAEEQFLSVIDVQITHSSE